MGSVLKPIAKAAVTASVGSAVGPAIGAATGGAFGGTIGSSILKQAVSGLVGQAISGFGSKDKTPKVDNSALKEQNALLTKQKLEAESQKTAALKKQQAAFISSKTGGQKLLLSPTRKDPAKGLKTKLGVSSTV